MAKHNDLGKEGELQAKLYLIRKGYEIVDVNWVQGKSEVDIIALFEGIMVFVEVKTRSSIAFGMPEDFVDLAKQKQLLKAAQAYIEIMDFEGEIRFDIISILINENKAYKFKHIEDAFWFYE